MARQEARAALALEAQLIFFDAFPQLVITDVEGAFFTYVIRILGKRALLRCAVRPELTVARCAHVAETPHAARLLEGGDRVLVVRGDEHDLPGPPGERHDLARRLEAGARHQHAELFAAEATEQIDASQYRPHDANDGLQHLISDRLDNAGMISMVDRAPFEVGRLLDASVGQDGGLTRGFFSFHKECSS